MSHDAHEFFDFDEQEPPRRSRAGGWRIVLVVLVGVVVALIFAVASLLSFDKAGRLADWAGNSMVVSGTYQTMTHDLVTEDYNGIYAGIMPDNELLKDHPFDNGLNDPAQAEGGEQITFRGTQTGQQDSDFLEAVDALVAVDDGQLRIMDTDEPGSYGEGITDSTVTGQRVKAGVLAALSLLSVAGTVWGVRALNRRAR
ncbi:hypothetical protein IEE91_09285 [Kocuria sp. cx-455]|uniref:hypothetical protein n=1 Tax=Kocuria sp. cx-455 TaxID=2771377 RepID=UPI001684B168|nr:hypothetical protein [Kocuria sp. cx-455]MBD2765374.1 hypothetical protein [Kocuria sp. cx-455]